jgi:uncharacterized protein YjiK
MRLPLLLSACLLATACASPDESDPVSEGEEALTTANVGTVSGARLPIKEVSGLGKGKSGNSTRYFAIGDASHKLLSFSIPDSGRMSELTEHDLGSLFPTGPSQWEGVAGDGSGKVFILSEAASTITVLDARLQRIVHTLKLSVPNGFALGNAWRADENSRAEGFVLLSNGHVIIAKEKAPAALIELGPAGSAAEGFRADLVLGDRAFPLSTNSETKLVALKHWVLKDRDAATISDISDLAVDDQNRLVLLTDQGRAIARVERTLDPTEAKVDVKAVFSLPARVDKPEGLVFVGDRPFVAVDGSNASADVLFEIARLP